MQIKFSDVSYVYNPKTSFKTEALKNVNLTIDANKITALVGKTGSGKSTLVQLINALEIPSTGKVEINNFVNAKKIRHRYKDILNLRKNVGYLFQFPENQLFNETVLKDVEYAVKNFYPKDNSYEEHAKYALSLVGLDNSFYNRSPFDLSGGEKKRVAIAGVLSYKPKLLILDEPTVGLDEKGKKDLIELLKKIHCEGIGMIIVTHDMDVVNSLAEEVIVLDRGEIKMVSSSNELFAQEISQFGLSTPSLFKFANLLKRKGLNIDLSKIKSLDNLIEVIRNHE